MTRSSPLLDLLHALIIVGTMYLYAALVHRLWEGLGMDVHGGERVTNQLNSHEHYSN